MKKLLLIFLSLLLLYSCQQENATGSIYGTVTDYETGYAINNALVSLLSSEHKAVFTDSVGYYEFNYLEVGRYEIEVQADGYIDNKKKIHVNPHSFEPCDITLKPILPVLRVSPQKLDFGTESKALSFEIANDGEGILDWAISVDADWLVCEPMSGKNSKDVSSVVVTVSREGLEKEHYSDNITITSNGGSKTIKVDLSVIPEIPVLEVDPTRLDFSTERTLTFDIINAGTGVLEWSLSEESDWFSCEPSNGIATTEPSSVVVAVSRNGLEKGNYSESIVVTSNGGSKVVTVKLAIDPIELTVIPEELDFGTVNSSLDVTFRNSSSKPIRYEVKTANSWLSVSKTSGTVTNVDKFNAIVSRQGLSAGNYDSEICISSEMGTITIPVRMAVAVNEKPVVTVESVDEVTYNTAMLSGAVVSLGSSAISRYGFCWSENPEPTLADEFTNLGDCALETPFKSLVVNLKSETKYYCRAYAENNEGISYSDNILTFTTGALPKAPTVETDVVEDVNSSFAKVKGNLSSLGGCKVTSYGHVWAETSGPVKGTAFSTDFGETANVISFESELNNLEPATKYYVRAYATNEKGTSYGKEVFFTTAKGNVILSTSDVTDIIHNAAVSGGKIVQLAGNEIKEAGVCWGIYDNPTLDDSFVCCDNIVGDSFNCRISGLKMLTSYYVRAYVVTAEGKVFYGESKRFMTTKEVRLPELSIVTVTNIQTASATVSATIVSDGNSVITECGFCWATTQDPKMEDNMVACDPTSNNLSKNISSLKENMTYYVRAWAKNAMGVAYGETAEFTTKAVTLPELSDVLVENIGKTTVYASSQIMSNGNSVISDYGFCWATSAYPTIDDNKISISEFEDSKMSFKSKITQLPEMSDIYICAFAINDKGVGYSRIVQFTTLDVDVWDGLSVAKAFAGGLGTSSNPILINSSDQFALFAKNVFEGTTYKGVHFKLTSNINLNHNIWTYSGGVFSGVLECDGRTVSGYNGIAGLFAENRGEIKNLNLIGNIIANTSEIGSICGVNSGTISNCIVDVDISNSNSYTGGLAGKMREGRIEECVMRGCLNVKGDYSGGVVGYIDGGMVFKCINEGVIESISDFVGGIVGYDYSDNKYGDSYRIACCVNKGSIRGYVNVGGILGGLKRHYNNINYSTSHNVLYGNINYGEIYGTRNTGGVIGFCCGRNEKGPHAGSVGYTIKVVNCLNVGHVESRESCGGICGLATSEYYYYFGGNGTYSYAGHMYVSFPNSVNCGEHGLVGTFVKSPIKHENTSSFETDYLLRGGYWLYDIVANVGQEDGVGEGGDYLDGWFVRDMAACYLKGIQDLVLILNGSEYCANNCWRYEVIDGYVRPIFDVNNL